MTSAVTALHAAVLWALAGPAGLLAALGLGSLRRGRMREATVARLTSVAMLLCVVGLTAALAIYAAAGLSPTLWVAQKWFSTGAEGLEFDLLLDGWALSFALLAAVISATVGAFSFRYLHRDPGFQRYFTLYACFVLGILLVALAGSIEVLLGGWELLGLSSALLVGFFHERPAPVANALRVFAIYRISDAAMLTAAVLVHHGVGSGSLSALLLSAKPVDGQASPAWFTLTAVFLVLSMAAKSALLPFSGWLPRAMEGPTPSSAVYYGALSVHAGCYLLWRAEPLLEQAPAARVLAFALGLATALYATALARVQTDVKSSLSFATLTQVGIIVMEIALGLRVLAFAHIVGNASLRLLQFLSAPNVLQDLRQLEARGGGTGPPRRIPTWLYLFSMERGAVDALIDRWVVEPFVRVTGWAGRLDRRLAGEADEGGGAGGEDVGR